MREHALVSDCDEEMMMIRVLLVEDHIALREPLAFMIDREPDMQIVGQAGTVAQACESLSGVDIALVDLQLPDGSGIDLIRDLRNHNREAQVIVLTGSDDRLVHARAYEAGAALVLHKSTGIKDIVDATRRIWDGEQLAVLSEIVDLLQLLGRQREEERRSRSALAQLTPREIDVLKCLASGMRNKEIAVKYSLSDRTVRNHVVSILDKLGVDSRLQAVLLGLRLGAVSLGNGSPA
jgi:DNA-binding NarL/FixJ family response regulator